MFGPVIGPIVSAVKEKLIDHGLEVVRGNIHSKSNSKVLERDFKLLVARADDIKKDISIQVQQEGRKRKREEVRVWLLDVKKVRREYCTFKRKEKRKGFLNIFGGKQAIQLNTRIRDLDERSRHFGELVVGDDSSCGLPRPATELEGKAFKDNFESIWKLLVIDKVSSIGVHGMGGVGKSTLVEHIYNQLLEKNECVFWVIVSQGCSIKVLQDKIAHTLDLNLSDEADVGARAGRLKRALTQRENFILILDDAWEHIDLVKVGIPLSIEGCKWMMTSRSLKVCQEMNCEKRISVKPLSEDEGWNLFLKNLGQDTTLALGDPEVEGVAKHMVDICNGLPLGIITLSGAMSGVTDIQEWRHALRVLKESAMRNEWMEEKVFRVLKYSFDRLSPSDQRCFLYCSLYPEDWRIPKEELFSKFISEELVDKTMCRASQRDEGHSVLTRLVKVSLLETDFVAYTGECVKMHDLVRAMALKITKGKTMVIGWRYPWKQIPIEEEWVMDLEKVSLMCHSIEKIPHGISPNCPNLSTLLLQQNPLRRIPESFFSQMCGLCTLDLSYTNIKELPNSVSDLQNLTSLLLGHCIKLQGVPCLKKLKALRELDLSATAIKNAPQGMEELVNIRYLSMHATNNLLTTRLKLKSPWLQFLRLPYQVQAKLVERAERLEVFEGWLKRMSDFSRLAASKQDAISYYIVVSDLGEKYPYFHEDYQDGERKLVVSNHDLKDGEENEFTILAEFIHYLEFTFCKGLGKCLLDNLSNPASLKDLKISYSEGIECILTYDQFKTPQHSKSRFQAVNEIELVNLQDFKGLIYTQEVDPEASAPPPPPPPLPLPLPPSPPLAFSSLRKLTISMCNKMKKLGLPLSVYENLEYISIHECEELEEIMQVAAADDDDDDDDDDDYKAISLPNLRYLSLVKLPSLESFCDAPVICNSITAFELKDCPRLEEPSFNRGTQDSYKPLFAGMSSSAVKKEWWEFDLFKHWSR